MSSSRLGIIVFLGLLVFATTNCTYYNQVVSRKNLVDGAEAYKGRKFAEAKEMFERAAARDPEGSTMEGRTAQLFLARTIHSQYIGDRQNKQLAEDAIVEYKKTLAVDPNEQTAYKAVAGLLDNLQKEGEWQTWVTERANNEQIKPQFRAEALTSLAAKQNTCANTISDTEQTKKPAKRDGKDVFQYVKPENPQDLERMRACVNQGTELIEKAVGLETQEVKDAGSVDLKAMTDAQLIDLHDQVKTFESARSYRTSLLIQASRLAEMDGREADAVQLRSQSETSRGEFQKLSELNRKIQDERDARVAALQQAENANAANANAAK